MWGEVDLVLDVPNDLAAAAAAAMEAAVGKLFSFDLL